MPEVLRYSWETHCDRCSGPLVSLPRFEGQDYFGCSWCFKLWHPRCDLPATAVDTSDLSSWAASQIATDNGPITETDIRRAIALSSATPPREVSPFQVHAVLGALIHKLQSFEYVDEAYAQQSTIDGHWKDPGECSRADWLPIITELRALTQQSGATELTYTLSLFDKGLCGSEHWDSGSAIFESIAKLCSARMGFPDHEFFWFTILRQQFGLDGFVRDGTRVTAKMAAPISKSLQVAQEQWVRESRYGTKSSERTEPVAFGIFRPPDPLSTVLENASSEPRSIQASGPASPQADGALEKAPDLDTIYKREPNWNEEVYQMVACHMADVQKVTGSAPKVGAILRRAGVTRAEYSRLLAGNTRRQSGQYRTPFDNLRRECKISSPDLLASFEK